MSEPYEPDRIDGVPHPRHTRRLFGQEAAERSFVDAIRQDRLHHAWLVSGPRGIGKATLVWRIARALLATRPGGVIDSLDLPADHPVAARVAALSEPRLFLLRPTAHPETGTLRRDITVDIARSLRDFLHLSSSDGGRRVVIVDAADQLNLQASNAILKLVEEPPVDTVLLMVCHAPARLLPTIRSRCRSLVCRPLGGVDLSAALEQAGLSFEIEPTALAQLAAGSAGEAARLLQQDGPALYADLIDLVAQLPDMDRGALLRLSGMGRERIDALFALIDILLARLARQGAGLPPDAEATAGEARTLSRLAPDLAAGRAWANLQQSLSGRVGHGREVNLDPSALVLDTGLKINDTGRAVLRG